jgi:hypothetical protein
MTQSIGIFITMVPYFLFSKGTNQDLVFYLQSIQAPGVLMSGNTSYPLLQSESHTCSYGWCHCSADESLRGVRNKAQVLWPLMLIQGMSFSSEEHISMQSPSVKVT